MFTLFGEPERVDHLTFSPGGRTLAAAVVPFGAHVSRIRLWDLTERRITCFLDPPDGGVTELMFLRDDAALAYQRVPEEELWLWDTISRQSRLLFPSDDLFQYWSAVAPEPHLVLGGFVSRTEGDGIEVRQLDLNTGWERRVAQFHTDEVVNRLAVRPAEPLVIAVQAGWVRNRVARLLSPGRPAERIALSESSLHGLTFSPDGQTLALRTLRSVRLWDMNARTIRAKVAERTKLHAMAFSPDSRVLATATADGMVRLYDAATGRQRGAFDWGVGPIQALAFAPDGMRAAAGGQQGSIVVWDVDP